MSADPTRRNPIAKHTTPHPWPTKLTPFFVACGTVVGAILARIASSVYQLLVLEGIALFCMSAFVILAAPVLDCLAAHWHQRQADAAKLEGRRELRRAAMDWLDQAEQLDRARRLEASPGD